MEGPRQGRERGTPLREADGGRAGGPVISNSRFVPCDPPPLIPLIRFASLGSTNREAVERIRRGELGGPVALVAERQTGGYGRHGRPWQGPPGGLWWTLAWPWGAAGPELGARESLGVRVGAAALEAIQGALPRVAAERATLKWPNDVLIGVRKVCGCLCEEVGGAPGRGAWVVVGVGINANNDAGELGDELRREATSLRAEAGAEVDAEALRERLTEGVARALRAEGGEVERGIRQAAQHLYGLDGPVRLRAGEGVKIRGVLRGLTERGRLMVEVEGRLMAAPAGAEVVEIGEGPGGR